MDANDKLGQFVAGGYVVVGDDDVIWGIGATVEEAEADFERVMADAKVQLAGDDFDPEVMLPLWTRYRSSFKTLPASYAIIVDVDEHGGEVPWIKVGGIVCPAYASQVKKRPEVARAEKVERKKEREKARKRRKRAALDEWVIR
jgi:hypothetical protein